MKPTLFKIHEGKASLANAEIALYPEFKRILERDKKGGKDRDQAMREFHFVWLISDYQSPLLKRGLTGDELYEEANIESGAHVNIKSDLDLRRAVKKYRDLQYDTREELIKELISLFRSQLERVKVIKKAINTLKKEDSNNMDKIRKLLDLESDLFNIATQTPGHIRSLNNALSDIESMDRADKDELRGGGEIPDSANPETSL